MSGKALNRIDACGRAYDSVRPMTQHRNESADKVKELLAENEALRSRARHLTTAITDLSTHIETLQSKLKQASH